MDIQGNALRSLRNQINQQLRVTATALHTLGLWFAAAVIFLSLTIGTFLYRTSNADVRTASVDAFPSYANIEGIDR